MHKLRAVCLALSHVGMGTPVGQASAEDAAASRRLVRQLGSDSFEQREAASKALLQIGEPALAAVQAAVEDSDAEVCRRARALVRVLLPRAQASALRTLHQKGGRIWLSYVPNQVDAVVLAGCPVADRDLAALRWLKGMQILDLSGCPVTDAGMTHVQKHLPALKQLDLSGTRVTDEGLKRMAGIKNLAQLGLARTQVTGRGLAQLRPLVHVCDLNLSQTKLTEEDLKHLADLHLVFLHLCRVRLTEASLAHLARMENLQLLDLEKTGISEQQFAKLNKALPATRIQR